MVLRIPEYAWVMLCAVLSGLLLFVPSLSQLGQPANGWIGQVYETFFHT